MHSQLIMSYDFGAIAGYFGIASAKLLKEQSSEGCTLKRGVKNIKYAKVRGLLSILCSCCGFSKCLHADIDHCRFRYLLYY